MVIQSTKSLIGKITHGKDMTSLHSRHQGNLGKEAKDTCNKDPLLFISVDAGGRKIEIGKFALGGKQSKILT